MLVTTAVFASILALMFIKLSLGVIALRRKNKVSLGAGGVDALDRAIRAHGNFAEYVPLGLCLIGALELNGAPLEIVGALGLLLFSSFPNSQPQSAETYFRRSSKTY
jgi:uncharacterized membrane protein YecN with MAPEG domain